MASACARARASVGADRAEDAAALPERVAPLGLVDSVIAHVVVPALDGVFGQHNGRRHDGGALEQGLETHLVDKRDLAVTGFDAANAEPVVAANVAGEKAGLMVFEEPQLDGLIWLQLHREHRERTASLALKSVHRCVWDLLRTGYEAHRDRDASVGCFHRVATSSHEVPRLPTPSVEPYLAELLSAPGPVSVPPLGPRLTVATYNVHRWAGVRGGRAYRPERALDVLDEVGSDIIALQEALRPYDVSEDPLQLAAERLGYHLAFVVTRLHKRGELGNAVLSRWPLSRALAINLSFGRLERRAALAVRVRGSDNRLLTVAATHLALVDRTRARQVRALLDHDQLASGPAVLLGDMNAWRRTSASKNLDNAFSVRHHNADWPASYPSVRPVLALDRLYARGARILSLTAHDSAAARRGSDHLPVVAELNLES